MSYTAIPNSDIDQDSPGTQVLFTRLRDNPEAIATGASGATRIAVKTEYVKRSSGGSGYSIYSNGAEYKGIWLDCIGQSSDPSTASILIDVSDDGITYSSAITILDVPVNENGTAKFFLDFDTGNYHLISTYSGGTVDAQSSTIGSYPSGAITHIRLDVTAASSGDCAFIAQFQGGEAVL